LYYLEGGTTCDWGLLPKLTAYDGTIQFDSHTRRIHFQECKQLEQALILRDLAKLPVYNNLHLFCSCHPRTVTAIQEPITQRISKPNLQPMAGSHYSLM